MICLRGTNEKGWRMNIILCLQVERITLYATFCCLAVNFNFLTNKSKKRKRREEDNPNFSDPILSCLG